ncbi:putative eukaryotic LigT [Forsythia ovata]|uniref:Eukaryotic LigT n=1 Tax=Forsythia ovata TaxID=205694 RepID=A0ABD1TU27_9LAMI
MVTQTWRAVSTQSSSSEARCENADPEVVNKPVDPNTCSIAEGSDKDRSLEGELASQEKHSISMEVGASVMHFIKGKEGATQKEIEKEMGVNIIFPSSKKDDSVIIEGNSGESVNKASEKIQIIIDKAVKSPTLNYSHFVSLPLAIHPGLVDKLVNFQNSILGIAELNQDLGIEKSIFIKPKTFHLTVLMLKLWNKDRVKAAAEVLQTVSSKVLDALDNRPVSVRLKGLECMRGSLAKAHVLYAPVQEIGGEDRLLHACQVIIDAFVEAGLVMEKDAQHKLKLHATVMNARHRKRQKRTRKVDSFDARGIFDQYGSEEWGEYLIREAHLSQRFAFDENGYYHYCVSIPFPENMQLD